MFVKALPAPVPFTRSAQDKLIFEAAGLSREPDCPAKSAQEWGQWYNQLRIRDAQTAEKMEDAIMTFARGKYERDYDTQVVKKNWRDSELVTNSAMMLGVAGAIAMKAVVFTVFVANPLPVIAAIPIVLLGYAGCFMLGTEPHRAAARIKDRFLDAAPLKWQTVTNNIRQDILSGDLVKSYAEEQFQRRKNETVAAKGLSGPFNALGSSAKALLKAYAEHPMQKIEAVFASCKAAFSRHSAREPDTGTAALTSPLTGDAPASQSRVQKMTL